MAYTPTEWKNREVERPRTFTITNNQDGSVTLLPAEGAVIETGTPIIAANMNKIEQGISAAHEAIDNMNDTYATKQEVDEYMSDMAQQIEDIENEIEDINTSINELATPKYAVCSTSSATTQKVITLANFRLVEGQPFSIKFGNENTADNPTLKINNETAYPIKKADGTAFKDIKSGVYTFIWDGSAFILQGESGVKNNFIPQFPAIPANADLMDIDFNNNIYTHRSTTQVYWRKIDTNAQIKVITNTNLVGADNETYSIFSASDNTVKIYDLQDALIVSIQAQSISGTVWAGLVNYIGDKYYFTTQGINNGQGTWVPTTKFYDKTSLTLVKTLSNVIVVRDFLAKGLNKNFTRLAISATTGNSYYASIAECRIFSEDDGFGTRLYKVITGDTENSSRVHPFDFLFNIARFALQIN